MSKQVDNLTKIADALRPWVIRPFYAVIGVGLFSLGATIVVTDFSKVHDFFWCVINNTELFGKGLEEKCEFPALGELTESIAARYISVSFIVMSFAMCMLYIVVALRQGGNTTTSTSKRKFTMLLPSVDSYLHNIITNQLNGSEAQMKLKNISMEDYLQLVVMTGSQPGEFDTELELLQDLLTRLRPHELGDLSVSVEGKNYRLTAT